MWSPVEKKAPKRRNEPARKALKIVPKDEESFS